MRIDRVVGSATLGLALAMGGLVYASDGAKLEASLVNADKNAARGAATVQVKVTGVEIVDPGAVGETVKKGQAHLHYTLDGGPVVATTATKLSFHGLKPGSPQASGRPGGERPLLARGRADPQHRGPGQRVGQVASTAERRTDGPDLPWLLETRLRPKRRR